MQAAASVGDSRRETTWGAGDPTTENPGVASAGRHAARGRTADVGVSLVLDRLGRIVHTSLSARALLGARSSDLVGRSMIDLAEAEDRLRLARWLSDLPEHDLIGMTEIPSISFRVVRRYGLDANAVASALPLSGATRWVGVGIELSGAPNQLPGDTLQQLVVLQQRVDQLDRSNRQLETLAGTAAHELKAPLGSLAATVELLVRQAGSDLDETSQELVGAMLRSVGQMAALVDGLLQCSRSGVGLQVEVADGDVLVGEAVTAVRETLDAAQAVVTVAPIGTVAGDLAQLRAVFCNLLANAARYRSSDRPLRVWIAVADGSIERTFTVSDNGRGIDPLYRDRVFAMFERVDPHVSGSGIGLATCQRIIEGHGGRIWLDDGVDGGIAVHFTLPAQHIIGG